MDYQLTSRKGTPEPPKWEKVLYKDFGLPDNYTDTTFLQGLQKNVHFKSISFSECVSGSTRIAVHLSIVCIFIAVYAWLKDETISALEVFEFSLLSGLFFMFYFWKKSYPTVTVRDNILFLAITYALAPILKTLTESVSTDSIYAMSTILMAFHLVFNDYGVSFAIVSKQFSLSTSLCAAICLASRLPTPFHVFSLLTAAICAFTIFPHFFSSVCYSEYVGALSIPTSLICLYFVDPSWAVTASAVFFFLVIVLPYLFVRFQKYKSNIYGPWDEAMLGLQANSQQSSRPM